MIEQMTTDTPVSTDNVQPSETPVSNWYDNLDAGLKEHPSVQKFNDVNGLAKSYLSLESRMGQGTLTKPKDENDVDSYNELYNFLGVPTEAKGYELKYEGVEESELEGFKNIAHELKMTPQQAEGALKAHIEGIQQLEQQRTQKFNEQTAQTEQELKQEWGLKYNENLQKAQQVMTKFAGDEATAKALEEAFGSNPHAIKMLANIGNQFSEGTMGKLPPNHSSYVKTPADAKAEYNAIMADKNDAYWAGSMNHRDNMQHCQKTGQAFVSPADQKARVEYVESLMKQMSAGQA
jgi:hypothetical protein